MTDTTKTREQLLEEIKALQKQRRGTKAGSDPMNTDSTSDDVNGRARLYLDMAGVFMVVISADQRVGLINQKGCTILGFPREEIVGRNWFDHFLPERMRASLPTTIEISRRLELNEAVVLADPTQVHQVLINLCTNAAQAMQQEGGILEVLLKEVDLGKKDLREDPQLVPGPYLELAIRDTGHGIPPESMDHIFEPYFTTKEKGVGTGLGLSVVHGIVKQYGGLIRVESAPGSGSLFQIFLPLLKDVQVTVPRETSSLPRGREHILVVDDEATLTDILKKALQHLGYRVTATNDPLEALAVFRKNPGSFHLVITDMTMPKMTGDRLAGKMLAIRPLTPVIICTGYSDQLSDGSVREIGARALLMKPIEVSTLAQKVREVLDS